MLIQSADQFDKDAIARRPRVLIIGGGFSGTMVAVQLARRDIPSLVIDPAERAARGVAYSTPSRHHFLNVRSGNMSALPHKPDDFAAYLTSKSASDDAFARRMDYGDYLERTVAPFVSDGLVTWIRGRAVRAHRAANRWQVGLDTGESFSAESLVLAVGNAPPAPVAGTEAVDKADLVDLFWNRQAPSRLELAAETSEPVLIVGTGLTMVDALLSLDAAGHRGPVTAVSRHGLLPLPHSEPAQAALPSPTLDEVPLSLSEFAAWLRKRAAAERHWQVAIDALRPLTQSIWKRIDPTTRQRFLRHGRAPWDVHRHRIAPALHARVGELANEGRLRILAGRLVGSERRDNRYAVQIQRRGSGEVIEVDAGLVINCTGPLSRLTSNPDPLIVQMLSDGLLRPDELELGAEIDAADRLVGSAAAYGIGPIARGRYWEITAVPDLRAKADEIAGAIMKELTSKELESV